MSTIWAAAFSIVLDGEQTRVFARFVLSIHSDPSLSPKVELSLSMGPGYPSAKRQEPYGNLPLKPG